MSRLYLSPPHITGKELSLIEDAFASNWIAPHGPHIESFEKEFAQVVGVPQRLRSRRARRRCTWR